MPTYHLIGTNFVYVHRKKQRWFFQEKSWTPIIYYSFEEVLSSVPEEIQTELLFHLDFFTNEIDEIGQ